MRFYAMSVAILANRKNYYEILEQSQRGGLDITSWLLWFLDTLGETFAKVLNRMLDGEFDQGINTSQYHKVAKVSKPTASRHLAALVEQGCLVRSDAGGRSTRYTLNSAINLNQSVR